MEPKYRISEYTSLILGLIGTYLLGLGAQVLINPISGFVILATLLLLFYQFVLSIIAFPFLVKSLRRERIIPWFGKIIPIVIIINSLLVLVQLLLFFDKTYEIVIFFIIVATIELFPIFIYNKNKDRIYTNY